MTAPAFGCISIHTVGTCIVSRATWVAHLLLGRPLRDMLFRERGRAMHALTVSLVRVGAIHESPAHFLNPSAFFGGNKKAGAIAKRALCNSSGFMKCKDQYLLFKNATALRISSSGWAPTSRSMVRKPLYPMSSRALR